MSRFAPIVTDKDMQKLLTNALKLINKGTSDKFQPLKNNDERNALRGSYLAIEAKNILTAVVVCGKWDELLQKNKAMSLPDPLTSEAGFRLSTWSHWPESAGADGLAGHAADQQANVVADIAFTRLMVRDRHVIPISNIHRYRVFAD
jgi:hypothetical protein